MKNLVRFAVVSLTLAATLVPWSAAEAQIGAGLTIDRGAQLLNSNQMLITGTVPCRSGATASITVDVSQNAGGQNGVSGSGQVFFFSCNVTGPQPYAVVATTFDGFTFHTGKAHVVAHAEICNFDGCGGGFCTEESNEADVHVSK